MSLYLLEIVTIWVLNIIPSKLTNFSERGIPPAPTSICTLTFEPRPTISAKTKETQGLRAFVNSQNL